MEYGIIFGGIPARAISRKAGLSFTQMMKLADFAKSVPNLPINLNHIGALRRVVIYANRDDEVRPAWQEGIDPVAACPNITLKLGGMGMPWMGFSWHIREVPIGSEELAESMSPWMNYCIE